MRVGPYLIVGVLLLVIWLAGLIFFHATGFVIHIFLICGLISFVIHKFWAKE
jgi:hypothetical protein